MSKLSVMIATPAYGGQVHIHYVSSLMENILHLNSKGVETQWFFTGNESLIQRGRNTLAHIFLTETSHDYLMFIDGDIQFSGDAIYKLIQKDKDLVCAVYPKKNLLHEKIKEAAIQGKENFMDYGCSFVLNTTDESNEIKVNQDGLVEVVHAGTGFMLIKRRVFEKLKPYVGQYRNSVIYDKEKNDHTMPIHYEFFGVGIKNGLLLSEDWFFCEKWLEQDGKIYIDPSIKLGHVGQFMYSGDINITGKNIT
jgi:hypothetical protein